MAEQPPLPQRPTRSPGQLAEAADKSLRSYAVGAVPILNHILQRLDLETLLERHLPAEDARTIVPTATGLLLLVRNVLVSREPIYGVADWACGYAPDLLDLSEGRLDALNDDRLGRCLNRLFQATGPELILDVVRQAIREFGLRLEELHNDSTSISFHGEYAEAAEEKTRQGRKTHAITHGHSKDHRPDLKQLLYVLTVTDDGGVPVYFTTESGNTSDDPTHIGTWDLLCQLVGSPDFLYVADCKLASTANLDHITRRGGRFVTVLPGSRREDAEFRGRLKEAQPTDWQHVYDVSHTQTDLRGKEVTVVTDHLSVWAAEQATSEGYRLLWYHSSRKAEQDRLARVARTERALLDLVALRKRLEGPKTRFRERAKVEQAVAEILSARDVERWVRVRVEEQEIKHYRATTRGRPGPDTRYVCDVQQRFALVAEVDREQLERETLGDGVFPLITNQRQMTAEELLRAYKRQPLIEKRFSQFKNDFQVAPVYLKEVSRIQGLLGVYFLALLVQTLLERDLRQAMLRDGVEHLPLYGEDRECRRPTTRKVIDAFEPVQRHVLTLPDGRQEILRTQLTPRQTQILQLLGISADTYGQ
jgi:transposase